MTIVENINARRMRIMVKAIWNGVTIAESDRTILIEGNHYFPPESVHMEYLTPTESASECPWKGHCTYFTIHVNGAINIDAAWTYPDPRPAAKEIAGYIAFWKGVLIEE
jgi:uncharacterized protein (DUF427 family)